MKLLLCEWEAYMQEDLDPALVRLGIEIQRIGYCFANIYEDEYFVKKVGDIIDQGGYDGVMTMNYYPVLAVLCHEKELPYIAWVYDSPFNVNEPERTLGLPTNHVFFFDRSEAMKYQCRGFDTVRHLELAVNTERLDRMKISRKEQEQYACDVAFVGSMYGSAYPSLYNRLDEYEKGFFDAVIDAQMRIYGCYFLGNVLTDDRIVPLKDRYDDVAAIRRETEQVFAAWVRHITASEVTRRERVFILNLLSRRRHVKLYSGAGEPMLPQVEFCGTADSYSVAPKVYRVSRINLNMSLKEIASGIPLRVMDILGAGGFLLTNYQPEIAENFVDGQDLAMYESVEDAVAKAEYYLTHEEERREIAANGRKAVERFSFTNQLRILLNSVYGSSGIFPPVQTG